MGWRHEIEIVPAKHQTPEQIAEDIRRSNALAEDLRASGVQEWRSYVRTFGRLRVAWTKEVGPPPWKWPRIERSRIGALAVRVGWRHTAYSVHLMVRPRRRTDLPTPRT